MRWFAIGLPIFVAGLAAGLLFAAFGMVAFVRVLGLIASIAAVGGIAVCLVGRDDAMLRLAGTVAVEPPVHEPVARVEPTLASSDAPTAEPEADVAATAERLPTWPGVAQPV